MGGEWSTRRETGGQGVTGLDGKSCDDDPTADTKPSVTDRMSIDSRSGKPSPLPENRKNPALRVPKREDRDDDIISIIIRAQKTADDKH